jgi:hypothetical protein
MNSTAIGVFVFFPDKNFYFEKFIIKNIFKLKQQTLKL